MLSIRKGVAVVATTVLGAGVFVAAPTQAAQYPPTQPVRCGASVEGRTITIKIRPLNNQGYRFVVEKRKSKGNWKNARKGRTNASTGKATVTVKPGRYRLKCIGGPDRLNGITSSKRVR